ncbi:serine protease inhibitor 4, serpin-4, putative [Ricinus communis]|uniref:Serine protease inhibitor 4, serpin-4, putative n=1 Tax=Ricinus communis TaxID=3988 RepID=B9RIG2_RICCO|nr:serine protease inhibitor 4, serpin-4, putative [Ricinus communis]
MLWRRIAMHMIITWKSQTAFVDVNEEGTEAAAVTFDDDMGFSLDSPPPIHFIADHPFLFMIREHKRWIPFYIGIVLQLPV